MTTNPNMAASRIVGAQADAMRTAAGNPNGAMNGFVGVGMAQGAGGANAATLFQLGGTSETASPAENGSWDCSCGKKGNTGKFCSECGKARPEGAWFCTECGAKNTGKFCSNCGKPRA